MVPAAPIAFAEMATMLATDSCRHACQTDAMGCCAAGCGAPATIRQPLTFSNRLELHVPLCDEHSVIWVQEAVHVNKAARLRGSSVRDQALALDAALAWAALPPKHGW